jgi:hypothetical protein
LSQDLESLQSDTKERLARQAKRAEHEEAKEKLYGQIADLESQIERVRAEHSRIHEELGKLRFQEIAEEIRAKEAAARHARVEAGHLEDDALQLRRHAARDLAAWPEMAKLASKQLATLLPQDNKPAWRA